MFVLQNHFRFRGRSKNCFRVAIRRLQKSWQYAYRDRRRKRREWSKFWIQRIQAGVRQYSWRYSQFMGSYKHSGIKLDRKVSLLRIKWISSRCPFWRLWKCGEMGTKKNPISLLIVLQRLQLMSVILYFSNSRQILAELAANEPFAFRSVVQVVEHTSKGPK